MVPLLPHRVNTIWSRSNGKLLWFQFCSLHIYHSTQIFKRNSKASPLKMFLFKANNSNKKLLPFLNMYNTCLWKLWYVFHPMIYLQLHSEVVVANSLSSISLACPPAIKDSKPNAFFLHPPPLQPRVAIEFSFGLVNIEENLLGDLGKFFPPF